MPLLVEKIMQCEVCGFWEKVGPKTIPDTAYKSEEMLLGTTKNDAGWGKTETGFLCPDDLGKKRRADARAAAKAIP